MSLILPPLVCQRLERAARGAVTAAYAPYSGFRVGAAVLGGSGKIFTGCNVENASYGLCNCAERTAIFTAIAAGERKIKAVAVYTPTAAPTAPCGACRQVINEFGPEALIISCCKGGKRIESTLDQLLPEAFGPKKLRPGGRKLITPARRR
jgi:cytidine deaminase